MIADWRPYPAEKPKKSGYFLLWCEQWREFGAQPAVMGKYDPVLGWMDKRGHLLTSVSHFTEVDGPFLLPEMPADGPTKEFLKLYNAAHKKNRENWAIAEARAKQLEDLGEEIKRRTFLS